MVTLSKKGMLILISTLFVFVLLVESCVAPVTTPANPIAAPEVSVEIHNNPIWHPPEEYTNPYTGEVIWSYPGFYSTSGIIEITIKNRSFTPYKDTNHTYNIYYCVFMKLATHSWDTNPFPRPVVYQSDSAYTVISLTYDEREMALPDLYIVYENTKIDFRIQAVEGYFNQGTPPNYFDAIFEGEGSAFTEFTITIPNNDKPGTSKPNIPAPSNTPSVSSKFQQQSTLISVLLVCIVTILLFIVAYQYRQRKAKPLTGAVGVVCECEPHS